MHKALRLLWSKKWILVILLLVAAAGFWWWQKQASTQETVATVKPAVRDIREVLRVSGTIDAEEKAVLKFPGASQLTWIGVKEGDRVKKWQGIARVDTRQLQKQMEIAMNTQGKTFRSFEQTFDNVDYYDPSGLTETERRTAESAQLDLRNSVLNVELADLAVKLAYMYSPINGIVVKVDQPNVGAIITLTDTFNIVNPKSIYFTAVVDEEDIAKVSNNQVASIELDAYADAPISSTVYSVAFTPTSSESGGTGYKIKLTLPLDNELLRYKLGMNGDADVLLREAAQVLSVPVDALIERDGKTYVEIWRNNEKVQTEIVTGVTDDDYIQVLSGLSDQDDVVIPTKAKN